MQCPFDTDDIAPPSNKGLYLYRPRHTISSLPGVRADGLLGFVLATTSAKIRVVYSKRT